MPATWRWLFERVESPLGGNQRRRGEEREREREKTTAKKKKAKRARAQSFNVQSALPPFSGKYLCECVYLCEQSVCVYVRQTISVGSLCVCINPPSSISGCLCVSFTTFHPIHHQENFVHDSHFNVILPSLLFSFLCGSISLWDFFFKKVSSSPTLRPGKQENASALQGSFPPFFPLKRNQ